MGYFLLLSYRPVYRFFRSTTASNQEMPKEIKTCIYGYHLGTHTQDTHNRQCEGIKYLNLVVTFHVIP